MILAADNKNGVVEIPNISYAEGYTIVSVDTFFDRLKSLKEIDTMVTEITLKDYKKIKQICGVN